PGRKVRRTLATNRGAPGRLRRVGLPGALRDLRPPRDSVGSERAADPGPSGSSGARRMNIELRDIDTIKPYDQNPRVNDAAVDAVAASLREFGWRQPVVVDGDDVIVVGHTRYKAARKLG